MRGPSAGHLEPRLETVLREVVECARAVTNTRYGSITTVDESGGPREFVTSGVSRELRASLASIKGSTTTLLNAPRDLERAETRQFIRLIDQGADQMQGLIGDLLDAGRIHAGTLSVDPEAVEVAELIEQARTTFLGGEGRGTLRVDLPPAFIRNVRGVGYKMPVPREA